MTTHARMIGLLSAVLALGLASPLAASATTPAAPVRAETATPSSPTSVPSPLGVVPAAACPLTANTEVTTVDAVTPHVIDVLANDCTGAASPQRPLTITGVGKGSYGTVTTDGTSVIYNPTACATGTDFVDYTISDGVKSVTGTFIVVIARPSSSPVTDIPQLGFRKGATIGKTVPMRLGWCGVVASSASLKGYRIVQSTNGGSTFPTVISSATTSTASVRNLAASTSYAWKVRTTDSKGRAGAYASSLASRLTRIQENSSRIKYSSGWKTSSSSRYSGGKERYTTRKGAWAAITVTNARAFAIVASKAKSRGGYYVYVDGIRVTPKAISQKSSKTRWRRVLYVRGLSSGAGVSHRITIKSAGSARIDLDAILTLSGKQDQAVTFTSAAPSGATYAGASYDVTTSASSGLPVALSIPSTSWATCSLDGGSVSFHAAGTCSVKATQPGDQSWNAGSTTQTFAVARVTLTVAGVSAEDKTYDATRAATVVTTGATLDGIIGTDVVTLNSTGVTGTFADANVGIGKTVQVAGLTLGGADAGNYRLTQPTTTAAIEKADQVITFTTTKPAFSVKDGPTYTVAAASSSGLPVSITVNPASAGVCTIAGSVVSFPGSGNCQLDADQPGNGNWNPAPTAFQALSVASTGTDPQTITFDALADVIYGNPPVVLTATASSGLPVTLTSLATGVCTVSGTTVTIVAAGTCEVEAGQAGDPVYAPAPDVPRSFIVAKKTLTVSGISASGKIYDGTAAATLNTASAALVGVIGPDAVTLNKAGATGTFTPNANVGSGKTVQVGGLTLGGLKAPSYTLTQPTTTASIAKATVSVTAADKAITYGDPDPAFTFTYGAFVNGETPAVIDTPPTCTVAGAHTDVAGSPYDITCSGGLDNNYGFSFVAGSLTIAAKPLTVSFTAAGRTYDATTAAAITGCSAAVIKAGDTVGCSFASASATFATAVAAPGKTVTGTGFTLTGADAGNYSIGAVNTTTATISKANAACTITGYNVTYNGSPHTATGTCLGVVAETLTGLVLTGTTHTNAGTYATDPWTFTDVTGNYNDTSGTVSDTIAKASQAITFTSTPPVGAKAAGPTYPVTATGGASVSPVLFTSGTPSICSISGSVVTFLAQGTCTIRANQAGTANYDPAPQVTQDVAVGLNTQTITFAALVGKTYGDTPFALTATASSGLPVSYASQTLSICSVSGSTLTILATGTCTVRASQAGDSAYAPATTVDQGFTVAKRTITVTADNKAITYGDPDPAFTFTYGTFFNGDTSTVIDTPPTCGVTGAHTDVAGSPYAITCSGGLDNNYGFGFVAGSLTIAKASQVITFTSTPPSPAIAGGPTYAVTATGGASGNPVTLTISPSTTNKCSISAGVVTFLQTGTCTIRADQEGSANYTLATRVTQDVAITLNAQTITFAPLAGKTYGNVPFAVSATSTSTLTVSFASQTNAVCTVSVATVTIIAAGDCTVRASQAGNATYAAATPVDRTFTVAKASQAITFTSTAPTPVVNGTYTPTATGGASGNLVTFTIASASSSVCSISTGVVTFTAEGTCTIEADQAGSANYLAAPQATQDVAVGLNAQTIIFAALVDKTYGDVPFGVSATSTSTLPVSFASQTNAVCTVSGTTVTIIAAGDCTIRASQAGNATYAAAPNVDRTFTVAQRTITVTAATDTKTADGTTSSTGVPTVTTGSLASGDVSSFTQTFGSATAGTGKTLTPTGTIAHGGTDVTASYAITWATATGTITPAAASLADSTITASPTSITADGASTSTITVRLKDQYGNNLVASGGAVTFAVPVDGTIGTVTDNDDGTYTATYTSGTTPGQVTITGKLDGNDLTDAAIITLT